jgi:hypothetical protein
MLAGIHRDRKNGKSVRGVSVTLGAAFLFLIS